LPRQLPRLSQLHRLLTPLQPKSKKTPSQKVARRQHPPHQPLRRQPRAFHARVTTHSLQPRAWAFHARLHAQVTTHSLHRRAWVAQALLALLVLVVRLVPVALVVLVAQVAQVVRLVPVALVAQVAQVALVAQRALALAVNAQASVAALVQVPEQALVSVHLVQVVAQVRVAVAVSVVEPRVHSVRVARAETQRPANPSAQNARNSNKELRRA